jgi:hypothetical protein
MTPKRSDEVLSEWSAVSRTATPPGAPPHARIASAAGPGISIAGAAVLVVVVVATLAWLGNRDGAVGPGSAPTATPAATPAASIAVAVPMASPTPAPAIHVPPTPEPSQAPTPTPPPAASPTLGPCTHLSTPLTWDGAAGQRIATITVTNRSDGTCVIDGMTRVQYVDAGNHPLIDGPVPAGAGTLTVGPHSSVTTMVEIGNYCGPAPEQPVGIAFTDGARRLFLVGSPASQADMSVPPCNGPGQPGTIQMHPWSGG